MYDTLTFRTGDEQALIAEFSRLAEQEQLNFDYGDLSHPDMLTEKNILAVHYADGGAQGESGAVRILYCSALGVRVLYGNYVYGELDLNAVIRKLPMLKCLDSRFSLTPPYPFGGKLVVPDGWAYLYMGAMNHFFLKVNDCKEATAFVRAYLSGGGDEWSAFDAVAWFCGAKQKA